MRPDALQWAKSLIADYDSGEQDSISPLAELRYEYISSFSALYEKDKSFRAFLSEPSISLDDKKKVVAGLLSDISKDSDDMAARFFGLLVEKKRFPLISHIAFAVRGLLDEEAGILRIRIESAKDLDIIELERLQRVISKDTGARRICASTMVNQALIAGVKIYSDGMCWDGSVTGRLKAMGKMLSMPLGSL